MALPDQRDLLRRVVMGRLLSADQRLAEPTASSPTITVQDRVLPEPAAELCAVERDPA